MGGRGTFHAVGTALSCLSGCLWSCDGQVHTSAGTKGLSAGPG